MHGSLRFPTVVTLAFVLTLYSAAVSPAPAETRAFDPIFVKTYGYSTQTTTGAAAAMLAKAKRQGVMRVIVGLDMKIYDEDALGPAQRTAQLQTLRSVQNGVIDRVTGGHALGSVTRYDYIPYMALNVDATQLRRLLTDPGVVSVQADVAVPPALGDSTKIIEANEVWGNGRTGRGWVVAVLDSGIDKKTPMLRDQVVSEACYSTSDGVDETSLCPGGVRKSTKPGSAKNCDRSIDACDHGTNVSSIAMGRAIGKKKDNKGVAHASKLIAIQIFHRISNVKDCQPKRSPCIRTTSSDIIKGLERVYALRKKYKIGAVNLSVGGGAYSEPCDSDFPAETAIIRKLQKKKIATIVASGNNGLDGSIVYPACISEALAVGATSSFPKPGSEKVASFSNHAPMVTLLAPGVAIRTGAPRPQKFEVVDGTSMAAPFVTGAFALLRQSKKNASVDDILDALSCTGKDIVRDNLPIPRIALEDAFKYLKVRRPQRSWNFNSPESAWKWTQLLGEWGVRRGKFESTKLSSRTWTVAYHGNCDGSLRVTAKVRRRVPDGRENLDWGSGLFVKATFYRNDRKEKTASGYWFEYTASPLPGEDDPFGSVSIWQMVNYSLDQDTGFRTRLCSNQTKVNYRGWNLLVVESRSGSHTFFINGRKVCTGKSEFYLAGDIGVAMKAPIFGERTRSDHKLEVGFLRAEPLKKSRDGAAFARSIVEEPVQQGDGAAMNTLGSTSE